MAIEVPLFNDLTNYRYQIELEGTVFTLQITRNHRDGFWYLSLLTADLTPLVSSVKMVYSTDLLGRFKNNNMPLGTFVLLNESGLEEMSSLEDVNDSELLYIESTEV